MRSNQDWDVTRCPTTLTEPADDRAPGRKLLDMLADSWKTQVAYVAAELKIMDLLSIGPMSSVQLAAVVGANGTFSVIEAVSRCS